MTKKTARRGYRIDAEESKKRRREKIIIFSLGLVLIILIWIGFRLFGMSEALPIQHSIFFFGLINFNIILFLLLMFLIFRNIVKNFSEREGGPLGSSLKSKLIAAFVGFSFVPTALMFTVSVFYINNSFEGWFDKKVSGALNSAIKIIDNYYTDAKKKNYHHAETVAGELSGTVGDMVYVKNLLETHRERLALDVLEYYPSLLGERIVTLSASENIPEPPEISLEFRKKGITEGNNRSTIHHFAGGDLVRVIVPVERAGERGAVVVSSFIPLSLINKMDNIAAAHENIKENNPLAYPVKSIYLIILILMTMLILLGATWFGFYLARQLSVPLEKLVQATQRVVKGDEYEQVDLMSGAPEINRLIENFNTMTDFMGRSKKDLTAANTNLKSTLDQLDEHSRYIEVVLAHITTGVISIDHNDVITMINEHAERLLDIKSSDHVGKAVDQALSERYQEVFSNLFSQMKANKADLIEKEIQVTVKNKPLILLMTITLLEDEKGKDLGKVLVFDDVSVVRSAQRAAAWTEVARRIAHEIKNPLTPISLAAQRLERKFGKQIDDPAFTDCTQMIVDQVDGLKNLVNEFSQFARMPKIQPVMCSLNSTLSEALKLFDQSEKNYHLSFNGDPSLPDFLFDPEQIRRVITNLIDNAVEGLSGRTDGKVEVNVEYNALLKIVRIEVSDNGAGIPGYMRHRVFEPYMTTKRHGTGLGLAIVKRSVEDHNGFIRALDNEPTGTRFLIELPVIVSNTQDTILRSDESKGAPT